MAKNLTPSVVEPMTDAEMRAVAAHIESISTAIDKLRFSSPLNDHAIIVLLQAETKLARHVIAHVLDGLSRLRSVYLRKPDSGRKP